MHRRAFVTTLASALPLAAFGTATKPSTAADGAARGFSVPAQTGREGESLRMFDRSWIDFKITSGDTGGAFFLLEQRDLLRFGPPRHVHHEQDEWFYPLRGTFRVVVGEDEFRVGAGEVLFAPRAVPHAWEHLEDEPGGMLVAFQPAGKMESFFREFTKHTALPPMPVMRELFEAHGMSIVGPPLSAK